MSGGEEVRGGTVNVRGLDWTRVSAQDKLRGVILGARAAKWAFIGLTELHSPEPAIVALEEWVLITGRQSGIMLNGEAQHAWREAGQKSHHEGDRVTAVLLKIDGVVY